MMQRFARILYRCRLFGISLLIVTTIILSFSIEIELGNTLIFSYIGYLTKEIIVNQGELETIYMEPNVSQLDEVVVIGYGTQKRSDLTGALSSISEKTLKQLPTTGLDQALQGWFVEGTSPGFGEIP